MWNRKELKEKGKAAYKQNKVPCIIAGLLLALSGAAGGGLGTTFSSGTGTTTQEAGNITSENVTNGLNSLTDQQQLAVIGAVAAVILVATLIVVLLAVFLMNPLCVGARKFFLENSASPDTALSGSNIGYAFSSQYKRIVGGMFTTHFFMFLWSLLLIVPGIIKSYHWRLVPYILSDRPGLTGAEARELSSKLMNGSKWNAFVLDLSFIGWMILGALTLGIVNLIWTNPYKAATDAELYLALSNQNAAV